MQLGNNEATDFKSEPRDVIDGAIAQRQGRRFISRMALARDGRPAQSLVEQSF